MTNDEIKTALECCQDKEPISCKKCPYEHEIFCDFKISKDALNLITEQERFCKRYMTSATKSIANMITLVLGILLPIPIFCAWQNITEWR